MSLRVVAYVCSTLKVSTQTPALRFHTSSMKALAVHTVNVPSMGDSISEGTLVQILKAPGDGVHADEVVAVLETDKVSVDVMSPVAGTIVEHFVKLEENVLVGAALFSVDDSNAPQIGTKPSTSNSRAAPPCNLPSGTKSSQRKPLIKFLGKRSLLPQATTPSQLNENSEVTRVVQPSRANVLSFQNARKIPITENEIAAINSGLSWL